MSELIVEAVQIRLPAHERVLAFSKRGRSLSGYAIDVVRQRRILGVAKPLHTVVETPVYLRNAALAGVADDDRDRIIDAFAADPSQGDEVRGSGGVRKTRIAGRGKGKSGGYRRMAAYINENAPVYLLAMLSKGDRADFSAKEIAVMKEVTANLRNTIRGRRR